MLEKYKTIINTKQIEIIEKKSRFIASISPIKIEDDAKIFIEKIKKNHWNATHNVFAYQLGYRNEIQRFSDDGEPSGTAGKPILDILINEDIKNIVIVVTRYFGGILLGTGGLVRAYSKAAKECIYKAGISEMILYKKFSIKTDYNSSGKIQYEILKNNHIIYDTLYSENVEYIVLTEIKYSEQFYKKIFDISNGKANINIIKELYATFSNDKIILYE